MARSGSARDERGIDIVGGIAIGAMLYVVGFILTYVIKSGSVKSMYANAGSVSPPAWKVVGWVYYRMHFVGSEITASGTGRSGSQAINIASSPQWAPAWDGWLLAIPPLLLVIGGALLARRGGAADPVEGVKHGLTLIGGYFPLAAGGTFLVTWSVTQSGFGGTVSASAGPKLGKAVIFAGLAYPLVFGAIGGVAFVVLASKDNRRPARTDGGLR